MKIDKQKLANLIESDVDALRKGFHCASTSVIGHFDGIQVMIVVTRDEDDFIEEPNPDDICIS